MYLMNWKHAIFSKDGLIELVMLDVHLGHIFGNDALAE